MRAQKKVGRGVEMFDPLLVFTMFMFLAAYFMIKEVFKTVIKILAKREREKQIREEKIEWIEW